MSTVEEELVAEAPAVSQRRSVRYWAAAIALAAMFFAMTKGPVFWVRLEIDRTVAGSGLLEDRWIQITFTTSAVLVLALALPAVKALWADRLVVVTFGVFLLTVLASSLWSVNTSQTAEQSAMFLVCSVAALAGGAYLRRFDALIALWAAMQLGVGVSIFAWSRDWPRLFNIVGEFAGIYFHKNSLGPVAMIGAASSLALGVAALRRGAWWVAPFAVGAMVVDGFVYWKTESFTAMFGIVIAVAAVVLFSLFVPGRFQRVRRGLGAVATVAVVVVAPLVVTYRTEINNRFDRASTLSGRQIIWDVVLDYVAQRPIGGWGFVGIWTTPDINESLRGAGITPVFEAHSGYLEVLLGVGLIGLAMLLGVVVVAVARVGVVMWRAPSVMAAWSFGVVVFVLAINLTESFIGPNLLPWVLLCVVVGSAVVERQQTMAVKIGGDDGTAGDFHDDGSGGRDDDTPAFVVVPANVPFDDAFDFSFDEPAVHPLGDPLLARDSEWSASTFGDTEEELDNPR